MKRPSCEGNQVDPGEPVVNSLITAQCREVGLARLHTHVRRTVLAAVCAVVLNTTVRAQFETRASVPGVPSPFSVVVGDFNRDGKPDFADATNNLQVFLGNGDGTFQGPINYLVGTGALFAAAADLNHDGKLDLVVADLNGLFVLIGNGDGSFQTPVLYATPCIPIFVSTGDFNGDQKLDLLVTYSGSCGYVSIFLGNGDGTFRTTPINTSPLYPPAAVGIGDFDGDGKLDIAAAEQFGTTSQIEIMLGTGEGGFSSGATYAVGSFPVSIAVADFRGSGRLDLAVATVYGGTNVLLGNGDGTFQANGSVATNDADWVVSADLNGDGKPDLAAVTEGVTGIPAGVNIALGNGDGTFQAPTFYPVGTDDRFVAVGDFNRDNREDLLVPDYRYGNVVVLLNSGVVTFSPITPLNYPFQLVNTTSVPQSVSLTNAGATALSISSFKTSGPFRESNTCGKSVAPGATCRVEVTFSPQAQGNANGTVSISDSASSKPQVIELTGAGTVVALAPGTLTFPAQKVGTKSTPRSVNLTNKGVTNLSITQIYVSGTDYKDFPETNNCPASLSADASCTITVTFEPLKTGTRRAAVYIEDNGGGSPQYVTVAGTGD